MRLRRSRRPAACLAPALGLGLAAAGLPPVRVTEQRFVDAFGRERHFRGVNVVYKDPPWLPNVSHFHSNLSFVQDDVDLLASWGVNLIRLGVMWPGVVPHQRGVVDRQYLGRARRLVRLAARAGIYTVVEPHQDELTPRFCGEGVPDWWADEQLTVDDFPRPLARKAFGAKAPTRAQCYSQVSFDYLWTHDLARAYQHVWESGSADFGDYWVEVAQFFAEEPAVLAGELWNEPFPGDVYRAGGRWRDNKLADLENLFPFYANLTRNIRGALPRRGAFAIAYEPSWPVGDQDLHPLHELPAASGFATLPEEDAVYAFHYYTAPCSRDFTTYLEARLRDASRLRAAPLVSELDLDVWDASSREALAARLQAMESRGVSYAGWQYKSYSGSLPTGTCTGCGNSFFHANGSANAGTVAAVARPFAAAVAGRALSSVFDQRARTFTLRYVVADTGGRPTEVVLPGTYSPVAEGIHVEVQGDSSARWSEVHHGGRWLADGVELVGYRTVRVAHDPSAAPPGRLVRLTIAPLPGGGGLPELLVASQVASLLAVASLPVALAGLAAVRSLRRRDDRPALAGGFARLLAGDAVDGPEAAETQQREFVLGPSPSRQLRAACQLSWAWRPRRP